MNCKCTPHIHYDGLLQFYFLCPCSLFQVPVILVHPQFRRHQSVSKSCHQPALPLVHHLQWTTSTVMSYSERSPNSPPGVSPSSSAADSTSISRVLTTSVAMTTSVLPTLVEEAGSASAALIPGVVVGVVLAVVLVVVVVAIVMAVYVVQWRRKKDDLNSDRVYEDPPNAYIGESIEYPLYCTA